ncbi:MAG: LLM class flavin-dependent oxidoreductase [Anaerolineales bacterium]|nr:LLM class flavin-dependent oxidoreductase [Anaerolineales bacterium]
MKYALNLPNFGPFGNARKLAELAALAESNGWDGFFIWDHINRPFPIDIVDPWIALTAAALSTSTIRLGTMITPIPRRRPWKLARETVSLDHLSNGRLIFGAGLGSGRPSEWAQFGEDIDSIERSKKLDEGLDILAGLWSGEETTVQGQKYSVDRIQFLPPALQKPRIPVWIGGNWPSKAPFRRAARWDGVFPMFNDKTIPALDQIRACRQFLAGQQDLSPRFEFAHLGDSTFNMEPGQAAEHTGPFQEVGVTWWMEPLWPIPYGCSWEEGWPVEKFIQRIKQGPPCC